MGRHEYLLKLFGCFYTFLNAQCVPEVVVSRFKAGVCSSFLSSEAFLAC